MQEKTVELPSGKTAAIVGMTGRSESILTSESLIRDGTFQSKFLLSCLKELDGEKPTEKDVEGLLGGDRIALMHAIRVLSLGKDFETRVICSNRNCRETYQVCLDLETDFETRKYEDPSGFSLTLPESGHEVKIQFLTGKDERMLFPRRKRPDLLKILFRWIVSVRKWDSEKEEFGPEYHPSIQEVGNWPTKDTQAIRQEVSKLTGGRFLTDDAMEAVACPDCGSSSGRLPVEALPSFFFPELVKEMGGEVM